MFMYARKRMLKLEMIFSLTWNFENIYEYYLKHKLKSESNIRKGKS